MRQTPYHHGDLRRALVEAALAELREQGPDGLSLRACARRAGVTPAAPTHHFGNADGLLDALSVEGFALLTQALRAARLAAAGADAALAACGMAYLEFAAREPALYRLMFRRCAAPHRGPDDPLRVGGAEAAAEVGTALAGALAARGMGTDDLAERTRLAWAGVHGLALLPLPPDDAGPAQDRIVNRLMLALLAA